MTFFVIALAGCSHSATIEASLTGYRICNDEHELILLVEVGPTDTDITGQVVQQTDDAVRYCIGRR